MIKTAAIVVLYHPPKELIGNIKTYLPFVSTIIVVDNTEQPDPILHNLLNEIPGVQLVTNMENRGIASAINQGMTIARSGGCDWGLTMDQDSYFRPEMIRMFFDSFSDLEKKGDIAVCGPVHDRAINPSAEIREVTSLITSGSIINTKIFPEVGGYDEKLFIDEVDHEYCYRAKLAGYRIMEFTHIGMEHSLGKSVAIVTATGKKKTKNLHSPLRLYYMVRNCLLVIRNYKKHFPAEMKMKQRDLLVRIKNNLLYGEKKGEAFRMVLRGYADYRKGRFGKFRH